MAVVGSRKCDICGSEIPGDNYILMSLQDKRTNSISETDTCLCCFDKLRSFIRNGMQLKHE